MFRQVTEVSEVWASFAKFRKFRQVPEFRQKFSFGFARNTIYKHEIFWNFLRIPSSFTKINIYNFRLRFFFNNYKLLTSRITKTLSFFREGLLFSTASQRHGSFKLKQFFFYYKQTPFVISISVFLRKKFPSIKKI
jgi:hypothetical protein